MITVTQHEKSEWSRLARDAYAQGRNDIGHRYSAAASLPTDHRMSCEQYDALQTDYRAWLLHGFV